MREFITIVESMNEDVWHSSPHKFDQFQIGASSGEGGHSFGWGLYFADSRAVADWYKAQFMRRYGKNYIYKVSLPDSDDYLLWDKPLSVQSPKVKAAAKSAYNFITGKIVVKREEWTDHLTGLPKVNFFWQIFRGKRATIGGHAPTEEQAKKDAKETAGTTQAYMNMDGEKFYRSLCDSFAYKETGFGAGRQEYQWNASDYLKRKGLVGIKYYNGVQDGYNYVIFDKDNITMNGIEDSEET